MSESVIHFWVLSLNTSASIHQAMTDVSALNMKPSESHVEIGVSRRMLTWVCQGALEITWVVKKF